MIGKNGLEEGTERAPGDGATARRSWTLDVSYGRGVVENFDAGHPVSDSHFNGILSPLARRVAKRHWTPVAIAKRAADLLTNGRNCRVLDVGSGVGKFCIVGALTTKAHFFGVERRLRLVEEAERICRKLDIPRVQFFHCNMTELDWNGFDAFYLYNPFQENIDESAWIDRSLELGEDQFKQFVAETKKKLSGTLTGTRVVTFHGFGGHLPKGFECEVREPQGDDFLELWVKKNHSVVYPISHLAEINEGFCGACTD